MKFSSELKPKKVEYIFVANEKQCIEEPMIAVAEDEFSFR